MIYAIISLDSTDTLVTPRELRMIIYLAQVVKLQISYQFTLEEMLKYFAYKIFKPHIPEYYVETFTQRYKPEYDLHLPEFMFTNFVINERNKPAIEALYAHLTLRMFRIANPESELKVGGLGGVLLEGNPGIGKSVLIREMLEACFYTEEVDYICLQVKLGYQHLESALLKAFHKGQIVVIDEINVSYMLERLLNALLEGHDLEDSCAEKPGFMLISSQNPSYFSGRNKMSLALKHRLQLVKLSDYTYQDNLEILTHMQIPHRVALNMLAEMAESPTLCFRDLHYAATAWLNANQRLDDQDSIIDSIINNLKLGNKIAVTLTISVELDMVVTEFKMHECVKLVGIIYDFDTFRDQFNVIINDRAIVVNAADLYHSAQAASIENVSLVVLNPEPELEIVVGQKRDFTSLLLFKSVTSANDQMDERVMKRSCKTLAYL